jgi:hypothetical protein
MPIPSPFAGSVREDAPMPPFRGAVREGAWNLPTPAGALPARPGLGPLSEADIARHEAEAAATPNLDPGKVGEEANRRIAQAHSMALSPEDRRVALRINPDTGSLRTTGAHFVEGDPVHDRWLAGLSPQDRMKLAPLSQAIARGDPYSFLYYSAPEEEQEVEEAARERPTGETRQYEQRLSSAEQRLAGAEGQLQRWTMIPQQWVITKSKAAKGKKQAVPSRVLLEGFGSDSAFNNANHAINDARIAELPVPYKDTGFEFQRDLAGYIQNQQHGIRGDGMGPILTGEGRPNDVFMTDQAKPAGERYVPHLLSPEKAMFVNMAMNIVPPTTVKPPTERPGFGEHAQWLARVNQGYLGQEQAENKLRSEYDRKMPHVGIRNKKGEITRYVPWSKGTLESTYRAFRLEHIRSTEPPILGPESIRAQTGTAHLPHMIMKAPIAVHTAAEYKVPERPSRAEMPPHGLPPAPISQNPEMGAPLGEGQEEPTSTPEPGLIERNATAAEFNPRQLAGGYPEASQPVQPPPEISGGMEFVSPSIREGMGFVGAKRALQGPQHAQMVGFSNRLEDELARQHGLQSAANQSVIGKWADGAENSLMTSHAGHPQQVRDIALALKGLHSAQRQVAGFEMHPEGEDSLYRLLLNTDNLDEANSILDKHKIGFRTLEPAAKKKPVTVHFISTDPKDEAKLEKLIKSGHVREAYQNYGTARFIGDEHSRENAASEYRRVLQTARDQAGEQARAGGGVPSAPWWEPFEREAEANYAQLRASDEYQKQAKAEDLRQAAIDRENLTPGERRRLNRNQRLAQQYVRENPGLSALAAHQFLNGNEQFPDWVKTKEGIGKFFGARNSKLDYSKEADREIAIHAGLQDVMHAIAKGSKAPEWYNRTVDRSLRKIGEVAPAIFTDPEHALAFKLATAITSQGQDVFPNFESGYLAYRHWAKTGEMPTDASIFGGGSKSEAMIANFQKINKLWDDLGTEKLSELLAKPMTMRQLRDDYGQDPGNESLDHTMEGAALLGPKIGSFFNNLNKRFHTITFDMWASRTINRMAGDMFGFSANSMLNGSGKKSPAHLKVLEELLDKGELQHLPAEDRDKMRAEIAALRAVPPGEMTREKALETAPTMASWADRAHKVYAKGFPATDEEEARSYPEELKTPENSLAKNIDLNLTDLSDAPGGAEERENWRKIFNGIRERAAQHGIKLTNADVQATLWYVEQGLFRMAGSRNRPSYDYLDAAHRLVRKVKTGLLPTLQEA